MDGFIEGPNGELDWLIVDDDHRSDMGAFFSAFDTIFYGRKAYERMTLSGTLDPGLSEADREFFYQLHGIRKYVFSRTQKHVKGNGMVVSENLEAEVKRIRNENGKNIWLCGGADILRTFAELDLVDEYVITIYPVLLAAGKPLFVNNRTPPNLKLISKRDLKSGVVILHYKPESRLKTKTPWL
jgi:dihydrofolate reductase